MSKSQFSNSVSGHPQKERAVRAVAGYVLD